MTPRAPLAAAVLVVMMACDAFALGADRARDESDIRQLQAQQKDAWNRHDARAYAALFSDDGEVVNVVGWWWRGRPEIERQLTAAYAVTFRDSLLTITDVEVRFLGRDIAIAHVRWTMEGARTPPPIPEPRQGIQIQVLHKRGGAWRIVSFQNTNSLPEVPFPAYDGSILNSAPSSSSVSK
jgi:uncharacterized protein (TIGR02246 family)